MCFPRTLDFSEFDLKGEGFHTSSVNGGKE